MECRAVHPLYSPASKKARAQPQPLLNNLTWSVVVDNSNEFPRPLSLQVQGALTPVIPNLHGTEQEDRFHTDYTIPGASTSKLQPSKPVRLSGCHPTATMVVAIDRRSYRSRFPCSCLEHVFLYLAEYECCISSHLSNNKTHLMNSLYSNYVPSDGQATF